MWMYMYFVYTLFADIWKIKQISWTVNRYECICTLYVFYLLIYGKLNDILKSWISYSLTISVCVAVYGSMYTYSVCTLYTDI